MKERQLAICDKDELYLERFQTYLLKKRLAGFEILAFSTVRQAVAASREEGFEILLVGENTYDTDVINVKAVKTFILKENGLSGIKGYTFISKYQSMEAVIGQVLEELAIDEGCGCAAIGSGVKARLTGFYSPDRHAGQSIAALCAAELLADAGKKVLYISLSPFSGFEELFGTKYEADLTDLVYFALKHPDKLFYKLEAVKRTAGGADYIPPALDYADLLDISEREWQDILDALMLEGEYTDIVIDLTECCRGFYHMLDRSDKLYILSDTQGERSKAVLNQFQNLLLSKEYGRIIEKSRVFNLCNGWEGCASDIGAMALTGLGEYMKGVMSDDGGQ